MKKYDVVALGELLIDFTSSGEAEDRAPLFKANPGGAPCNVLAMLSKLGKACAFIGKVGDDMFGRMLSGIVESVGIDISGLSFSKEVPTTLAFVRTYEDGDRDFSFYRNPGADVMLTKEDLKLELIKNTRIFHYGSLSMTHASAKEATREAIQVAREDKALLSFDPNLRPSLWSSLDEAKEQIIYGLGQCDILKISDNELEFIAGTADFDEGARLLKAQFPQIKLLNVTAGANGSYCYYKDMRVFVPAYRLGGTIDTTGAGDTFCASVLNFVLEHGIDDLSEENIRQMLSFANAAAYLVTTRKGTICVMPDRQEVEEIIACQTQ